jgi:glycerol-3-phosphate acyltransferase PlsY
LDKRKVGSKANGSTNTQRNGTMFLFHLTVQDGTEPCEYLD